MTFEPEAWRAWSPDPAYGDVVDGLADAVLAGESATAIGARKALTDWITGAAPLGIDSSGIAPIDPAQLPHEAAVYLISSVSGVYVGLALDVHHRFWNAEYGHLTPANKCRSRLVLDARDVEVRLLMRPMGSRDFVEQALSRGEIAIYAALAVAGEKVVNSVATLGRVGESTGAPIVLCDYVKNEYVYCDALIVGTRLLKSTALPAVVHGYQRTALGHAARWALPHEVDQLAELVPDSGVVRGAVVADAVRAVENQVQWDGKGRNAGFIWHAGPLTDDDCEQLRRYGRGRYGADVPQSSFNGVSWEKRRQRWQCRAKTGPGPKELWQTSRMEWTSDVTAAIFREEKIREEGWETFNTGRYASNADALNEILDEERFTAW